MATHALIYQHEDAVIQFGATIRDIEDTLRRETCNGKDGVYVANRDPYGTLATNLRVLGNDMVRLAAVINAARQKDEE